MGNRAQHAALPGVSIRFEVRGGFRLGSTALYWVAKATFQSALRFAVVSDGLFGYDYIRTSKTVSIRFEVRGGFRQVAGKARGHPAMVFQSALRFAVVSDFGGGRRL